MTCDRTLSLVTAPLVTAKRGACPVMVPFSPELSRPCLKPLTSSGQGSWTCTDGHHLTARPELRPVGGIGAAS